MDFNEIDFNMYNVYNINYSDNGIHINSSIGGRVIHNGFLEGESPLRERYIIDISLDPKSNDFEDYFHYALYGNNDVAFTIGIDYRFFSYDIMKRIIDAYKNGKIKGVRILPHGHKLTKDIYDMLNISDLKNMLVSVDDIEDDIDLSNSDVNVVNGKGIVVVESIDYTDRDYIYHDNLNIHITSELNESDLNYVVELLNNGIYQNIIVDFYEPTYYKKLLDFFAKKNIPRDVSFRFLANPLYDVECLYDGLQNILPNKIFIEYNTCNDLNDFYRYEPYSEGVRYYSDIEAGGRTDVNTYREMLDMIDKIVQHMENKGYSPLEKVAYLYDYFKTNYKYNVNYTDHGENSFLDKIFSRNDMICEGFSNLFSAILRRAGLLCFTYGTNNHQKNIIRLTDEKYGVDKLAIIDSTWDLYGNKNKNQFDNFLININHDLYALDSEVINIPTSFVIDQKTYDDNIERSNPGYVLNPFGYGTRMLGLMGLAFDGEMEPDLYRDALCNSGLLGSIDTNAICNAIINVRKKENVSVADSQEVFKNVANRGRKFKNTPAISSNDGMETIPVTEYRAKTKTKFIEIPAQNTRLKYPRSQMNNESDLDYNNYLHSFYYERFINSDINGNPLNVINEDDSLESQNDSIENADSLSTDDIFDAINDSFASIENNNEDIKEDSIDTEDKVNIDSSDNDDNGSLETEDIENAINDAFTSIENNNEDIKEESVDTEDNVNIDSSDNDDNESLETEDIENVINDAFTSIENNNEDIKEDSIDTENIENNTDENSTMSEDTDNLNVSESIEDDNTNNMYIPGTNILKPRDRYYDESNQEYEEYLRNYYDEHFPKKSEDNNNLNNEENVEDVDNDVEDDFSSLIDSFENEVINENEMQNILESLNDYYSELEDNEHFPKKSESEDTNNLNIDESDEDEVIDNDEIDDVINSLNDYYNELDDNELNVDEEEIDIDSLENNNTTDSINDDNNDMYIPGTNILKPRDRYYYESDQEYEEYLKNYYDEHFPKNGDVELITIYSDKTTNLLYADSDVVSRFNLMSAAFPAKIGDELCYRISYDDADLLVKNRKSGNNSYDVVIKEFSRAYERDDDEYINYDSSRRL